jgi:methionine-rich copper-binding protein CopC
VTVSNAAPDTTPPIVSATSPKAGATGVDGTANVTATFGEALDTTTINTTTFELRDAANGLVSAVVTYNTTTRVATLNPTPTLTQGAVYTATIRGGGIDPRVKDLAGNALAANVTWSFTIAPDITPPTVTSTSPASGATNVSRTANITATFSEAMNPTTIGTSTFELRDATNAVVPAVVTYSATTRVATLNPTPTLNSLTTYTATIKGGAADPRVKDAAGNALTTSRVWSFTTR